MAVQKVTNNDNDPNNSANQEDPQQDRNIPEPPLQIDEKSSLEAELALAIEAALASEVQNAVIMAFLEAQVAAQKGEKNLESSRPSCSRACLEEKARLREDIGSLTADLQTLQLFEGEGLKDLKAEMSKENEGLQAKILDLVSQLAMKEATISESLKIKKDLIARVLKKLGEVNALTREKNSAEEVKVRQESEIVELRGELSELRSEHEKTEKSNRELVSEVARISDSLDRARAEKAEAREALLRKKTKVRRLKEEVENSEARVDEIRKGLNSHVESARNEVMSYALELLKITASIVAPSRPRDFAKKSTNEQYSMLLAAIEGAFEDRQRMVVRVRDEIEDLRQSVDVATRGRRFWARVSAATTTLALMAVSLAYYANAGSLVLILFLFVLIQDLLA